jgi:hypothetical protein
MLSLRSDYATSDRIGIAEEVLFLANVTLCQSVLLMPKGRPRA